MSKGKKAFAEYLARRLAVQRKALEVAENKLGELAEPGAIAHQEKLIESKKEVVAFLEANLKRHAEAA